MDLLKKSPESKSDKDCARLNLALPDSNWTLEPFGDFDTGRLMGDYIHMSDGKVLIVNGAGMGYAGWVIDKGDVTNRKYVARLPQKITLLYDPKAPLGLISPEWPKQIISVFTIQLQL